MHLTSPGFSIDLERFIDMRSQFKKCIFSNNSIMILVFLLVLAFGASIPAHAESDIWMIDSYSIPWTKASEKSFERIAYFKLEKNRWVRSDAETFHSSQTPEIPVVIFSPGYTSTTSDTVGVGMSLYRICELHEKPFRMIFWNWPAKKEIICLRPDIRAKIPVATANGEYMSMFLRKLKPESKVSILGFSFGTRIVCDAVEFLGDDRPEGMRINLVLAAAATDQQWLSARSRHKDVPRLTEKLLVLYNPNDRALHFYFGLYNGGHVEALGRFGPPIQAIQEEFRDRIEAVNVFANVGVRHRTVYHLNSKPFRDRVDSYLLFGDSGEPKQDPKDE